MILNHLTGIFIKVIYRDILVLVVVSVDYEEGSFKVREIRVLVGAL